MVPARKGSRGAFQQPRRTVRMRLTVLCGGLLLASGAVLLAATYTLVTGAFPVAATVKHAASGSHAVSSADPAPAGLAQAARERGADLHHLLVEYTVTLAVLAVVSAGAGWLVAGRMLRPLREITAAARDISVSNLHERLAMHGPDDELKELGDTFDSLLGRLDTAFRSQRQFIANASHELRTPLTLERTLLEAALADPSPTSQTWRSACERALAAGQQQERLIDALLTLARSEAGAGRHEPLDLAAITGQILADHQAAAQAQALRLSASLGAAPAKGSPPLIERLITNLVDNAIRHNIPSGHVAVTTRTSHGHATLSVRNTGPLVPATETDRIFQPFHQLDANRSRRNGGFGLGLSIVQAVAAAHAADVTVRVRPEGGLEITVRFPEPAGPEARGGCAGWRPAPPGATAP
jgi:signal transduction histidine kinase